MPLLKVETELERPGIAMVEAFVAGFDNDIRPGKAGKTPMISSHPMAGFYVRRRRHGEQFLIANWEQFSPRWMKFVDEPPEGWQEKIDAREALRSEALEKAQATDYQSPARQQALMMSMLQMLTQRSSEVSLSQMQASDGTLTVNQGTGRVKPK